MIPHELLHIVQWVEESQANHEGSSEGPKEEWHTEQHSVPLITIFI